MPRAAAAVISQELQRPKRLIATGWDEPDSDRLPDLVAAIEQRPFDGVAVKVTGRTAEGKPTGLGRGFVADHWPREWFQPAVDRLRSCKFQRPMHNFVLFYANPGNVDWFDDAGWREVVDHWRTAAWVAKQSGLRGILFDPEPYAAPYSQFRYSAQAARDQHTFHDYYEQCENVAAK